MVQRSSPQVNLLQKLSKYADKHAFFYVTLDPERALGIEDIFPNYTIICPYTSGLTAKLKEDGVNVVVLEEELKVKEVEEIVKKGTYGMLQSEFVCNYINRNVGRPTSYIMILKNSALIEDLCKKNKWKLLAPKARIAEQFENKISQYRLLKNVVSYPETNLATMEQLLKPGLNKPKVLQFNRGHSGNSTFFINSKRDLARLYKLYPKREAKISKYIKGKTYTLNCLVPRNGGIVTGSLNEQITGLKAATANLNTTVGNDFLSPRKLSKDSIKSIQKIAQNVGTELHKRGYRGLFGIDVIISMRRTGAESKRRTGAEIYFIEVNTHQPASIPFEAKLHRKIGKIPLLVYFILDNAGGGGIKPDKKDIPPIILPISAKQVIYRNKTTKTLKAEDIDRKYKNKYLTSRMKRIKPNEEIYRKQFNND